jgi:lipopolysaccharide export system permease protein
MMAVLLTFLRLSRDNEIVALKASGIGLASLLPSVFLFSLLGCLLTGLMTIYGMPWGRSSLKEMTYKVAASHINVGLKENTFNDGFKGIMLYVGKIDLKNNTLIDVFIEDQRTENIVSTVVSPKGKLFTDPDNLAFHLQLYNGTINQVDVETRAVHSIQYDTYNITLDLKKEVSAARRKKKDVKEMGVSELQRHLDAATKKDDRFYGALIEFHKKFSIPFACFALGFLAVPLGVQSRSAKRSFGLGLGLLFFLFYYLLLSAGFVFGEAGVYPPVIGMWMPNVVTGIIGWYLYVQTAKERNLDIAYAFERARRLVRKIGV